MAGDKFSGGLDELTKAGARALGKTITAIAVGVGELAGKVFGGEREPEVASEGHSQGGGVIGWVKEALSGASLDVKEPLPQKTAEVAMAVAPAVSAHHADPAELGTFSPPSFGGGAMNVGTRSL